jgi:hypothetical protein
MSEPAETALVPKDHKTQYQQFVDRLTSQVVAALPLTVPDEDLKRSRSRFRVAFSADAQGALLGCTGDSIARCIVLSALSGLYPGGPRPDVWIIPRANKHLGGAIEANWQMSWRGFVRLARRAGWEMEPVLVFAGEVFEIREGDAPGVTHTRNLDLPQEWESLRYAYVRVFPSGHRDQARIGYLSKEGIAKRRGKAKDQSIWNEWPLEMALKTICNYAGNREMFPTDDPSRYAMAATESAEIGTGGSVGELWGQGGGRQRIAATEAGDVVDMADVAGNGRYVGMPTAKGAEPPKEEAKPEPAPSLRTEEQLLELAVLTEEGGIPPMAVMEQSRKAFDGKEPNALTDPEYAELVKWIKAQPAPTEKAKGRK